MQEINRLDRDAKELYSELEDHLRDRNRLARKVKRLAKQAKRRYPDMRETDSLGLSLHDRMDEIARTLRVERCESNTADDPILRAGRGFRDLFRFLHKLTDVPWLKAG